MPRTKKTESKRAAITKAVRGSKKRTTKASAKTAQPKKRRSRVAQAQDDDSDL